MHPLLLSQRQVRIWCWSTAGLFRIGRSTFPTRAARR